MKNSEPLALVQYKKNNPNSTYGDGLPGELSRELKTSLCNEQGYLCAYCMSRIRPFKDSGNSGMRVEHWDSQSAAPTKTLEYSNMLGVCEGQYDDKIYASKNEDGMLSPFCGVAIYYLKKRLKRL